MQISKARIALLLGLIFCAGAASGILGYRFYTAEAVSAKVIPAPNNEDWRSRFVESMRVRLKMDEQQMKQLNDTLDDTRVEFRLLRQRYKPEMEKIHQGQVQRIKSFLRPEQIGEFDKMEREREEKMRAREHGPGI